MLNSCCCCCWCCCCCSGVIRVRTPGWAALALGRPPGKFCPALGWDGCDGAPSCGGGWGCCWGVMGWVNGCIFDVCC